MGQTLSIIDAGLLDRFRDGAWHWLGEERTERGKRERVLAKRGLLETEPTGPALTGRLTKKGKLALATPTRAPARE